MNPYRRIVRAARAGKGVVLTAEECRCLSFDAAVVEVATITDRGGTDAGDEGACAGVGQEPATDIYANQGWTPDDPAISGEQETGGVRDKVFQAIISGDDAWDITDRVLAALSAPVDKGEAVADPAEFELIQDDMQVASVCAPRDRAIAEILHYAAVYGQDGPVEILEIVRTPWTLAALQGGSNA